MGSTSFLDFLWESSPSRESLARLLLRISTDAGVWVVASVNDKGAWIVAADWQRDERLLQEVARDLFDPIDELMLGLPDAEQRRLRQFLNAAALCDPAVPVQHVLAALGWNENARDEFLDRVDELLGEDGKVPVFADLGYSNPGFPSTELLYRFRNPALPGVVLKRCANPDQLAIRLLNQLTGGLRPDSRSIARLYLQLSEAAGSLSEAEQYANQLCWWTSLAETELLAAAIGRALSEGDVSPAMTWLVIERSKDHWPPARRMALLEAYGQQPNGVPSTTVL